jgi:hypothetical protein
MGVRMTGSTSWTRWGGRGGEEGREGGREEWAYRQALPRFLDEEGVVGVAGGVGLGLEEGIEIPEGGLNPLVGGHFLEAH